MQVLHDQVGLPSGAEGEYFHLRLQPGVIVVPIKASGKHDLTFILIEQYRYPLNQRVLEFPGGALDPGETGEQAARRELKEETGYEANNLKFMYSINPLPSETSASTLVYVASVGDCTSPKMASSEREQGLVVKEYRDDQLLQLIRSNEITDGKTLAALSVVMLQSQKALSYLKI